MAWTEKLNPGHGRTVEERGKEWLDPLPLKVLERECELPENLGLALIMRFTWEAGLPAY